LEVRQTVKGNVTVVHLAGEIWGRHGEPERLKSVVNELVAKNSVRVVFNLSRVKLISSIGIGTLIAGYKAFTEAGGAMAIAEPSDPIRPVFRTLRGPFEVFDSEDEAVGFVRGGSPQG
jgi:anti-anti-sigma factor